MRQRKDKEEHKKKNLHSSGLLRSRVTVIDKDGKRYRKPVYAHSQEELKNKVAQVRVEAGMGVVVTNDKSTWEYWENAWKLLTKPTVEAATWANYETALKHLSPLNPKKIRDISSVDVEVILSQKFGAGYSKRILSLLLSTASRIFRLARKNRAIMIDPTEDVKVPQNAPVSEREAIPPEVEEKLWNLKPIVGDSPTEKKRGQKLLFMRIFALMQLSCGLRREEVVPLKWDNVSLDEGTVTVDKAYNFKEKRIKEPKSKAGYRTVPIPDDYLAELKVWKRQNGATLAGRTWVFPYNDGIITAGVFTSLWTVLLDGINNISLSDRIKDGQAVARKKRAENPKADKKRTGRRHQMYHEIKFTSHQLRHTYATNCIASGIDVRTVQYLMGHASPEMTMDYTHLSQASLSDARAKINVHVSTKSKEKKA